MAHTPGPWKWSPANELDAEWPDFDALEPDVLYGVWHNDSTAGVSVMSRANALLIAAAPDMRETLKKFSSWWQGGLDPEVTTWFTDLQPMFEEAVALLAKLED